MFFKLFHQSVFHFLFFVLSSSSLLTFFFLLFPKHFSLQVIWLALSIYLRLFFFQIFGAVKCVYIYVYSFLYLFLFSCLIKLFLNYFFQFKPSLAIFPFNLSPSNIFLCLCFFISLSFILLSTYGSHTYLCR